MQTKIVRGGYETLAFTLVIRNRELLGDLGEVRLWANRETVDADARGLSFMMPDSEIQVTYGICIKAIYRAGERIKTFDLGELLVLPPKELEETTFLCGSLHRYV